MIFWGIVIGAGGSYRLSKEGGYWFVITAIVGLALLVGGIVLCSMGRLNENEDESKKTTEIVVEGPSSKVERQTGEEESGARLVYRLDDEYGTELHKVAPNIWEDQDGNRYEDIGYGNLVELN